MGGSRVFLPSGMVVMVSYFSFSFLFFFFFPFPHYQHRRHHPSLLQSLALGRTGEDGRPCSTIQPFCSRSLFFPFPFSLHLGYPPFRFSPFPFWLFPFVLFPSSGSVIMGSGIPLLCSLRRRRFRGRRCFGVSSSNREVSCVVPGGLGGFHLPDLPRRKLVGRHRRQRRRRRRRSNYVCKRLMSVIPCMEWDLS